MRASATIVASFALIGGCQDEARPANTAIETLPQLMHTSVCDQQYGDRLVVCRRFPAHWANYTTLYLREVLKQEWRAVSMGHGLSYVVEQHRGEYSHEPLWFERPLNSECSETLSIDITGNVTEPTAGEPPETFVEMLFIADYPPICGPERQL